MIAEIAGPGGDPKFRVPESAVRRRPASPLSVKVFPRSMAALPSVVVEAKTAAVSSPPRKPPMTLPAFESNRSPLPPLSEKVLRCTTTSNCAAPSLVTRKPSLKLFLKVLSVISAAVPAVPGSTTPTGPIRAFCTPTEIVSAPPTTGRVSITV